MNKLIAITSLALLAFCCCVQAAPGEQVIAAGETKTIKLNLVGAPLASAVRVSGRGISARITRKEATVLHVRLQASNNTQGGLRAINVTMPAGTDRTNLFVFDIARAPVRISGNNRAGQYQRVDLDVHSQTQDLLISPISRGCWGSKNGSFTTRETAEGYFPVTRSGMRRSFWVTRKNNQEGTCILRVEELSLHKKTRSGNYYKEVELNFRPDNRYPDRFQPPRLVNPAFETVNTRNTRGNSHVVRWTRMNPQTTKYIVYWGTNPNRITGSKEVDGRTGNSFSTRLTGLNLGDYYWQVSAVFEPSFDTALTKKLVSDRSVTRRFVLQQVN